MNPSLLQTIIKAVLALAVIPVLVALYYDHGKALASKWRGWTVKNRFFWILLGVLTLAAIFEIKAYRPETAATDKPLEFFPLSAYKTELDAYSPAQQGATWDTEKQQLMRKFEYAVYAWRARDFNEAAKALLALENGQDQVGILRKIPSFVVSNNLGCIVFGQHRNKEFKAYVHFQTAKDRVHTIEPFRATIEANITTLDQMVNSLD